MFYICRNQSQSVEYGIDKSRKTIDGNYMEAGKNFYERNPG